MKKSFCWAAVSLAAFAVTGCYKEPATTNPVSPPIIAPAPRDKAVVYVENPKATGDQDPLMPHTVTLRHPDAPARDAIDALLQAGGSPIPVGTSLRGLTIDNGLATLDFSRSPVNETSGEGGQGDALTALARTLGQFPDVRQFQIEVKGQIVKAFGEFTTDGPMDVIRPDAVRQAQDAKR